ncbi:MAG: tetratricopeptide repeat protein, partial [Microcystaceae cyanobacterium]
IQMYLIVHEKNQLEAHRTATFPHEMSEAGVNLIANKKNGITSSYIKRIAPFLYNFNFPFSTRRISRFPILLAGTGMSLLLGFCGLYMLTRPCVGGKCQAITQAQQLVQENSTILTASSTDLDLLNAQQKLTQAISILQAIPGWSTYYTEAQNQLQIYRMQLTNLDNFMTTIKTSKKVSQFTQNPPLSLAQWQEIKQQWENAIASLETLSPDSELSAFVQIKLQEYRRKMEKINQNLAAEQQAITSLSTAQQAAKIAQMRSDYAQSFSDWQSVYATWKTVIQRLQEIPPRTTAYQEAQQLLNRYTPQLAMAGSRKNQEQFAWQIYHQAIHQANLAKKAASMNQWSVAVANWQKVLVHLQQIPKTTFQSSQTQSLIATYSQELNQSKIKLKEAIQLQQISNELDQNCSKNYKICDYTIDTNLIKVKLTATYI